MKFIEEWKQAWRMFSIQAMTLAVAIQGAWPAVPDDLKATLPPHLVHYITIGLLVAGIFGRMVKQDTDPK
jgi:hypothetical protein